MSDGGLPVTARVSARRASQVVPKLLRRLLCIERRKHDYSDYPVPTHTMRCDCFGCDGRRKASLSRRSGDATRPQGFFGASS